jgi:GNAT superfamily N-acetyltransferase
MPGLTFRRAIPENAELVRTLTRTAYAKWVPVIGREPKPMMADHAAAIRNHLVDLAFSEQTLAGLVEMVAHDDHLLIENVAVLPEMQRKGVGKALVARAERQARLLGLPVVRLYTNAKFESNIQFYQRLGYVVERLEAYRGGHITHLTKTLPP